MILLYHKVDLTSPSPWWVDVDTFYRQLCELRSRRVVFLDDYDETDPHQVVITFDGVYQDIAKYAAPMLSRFGYPFELFVSGDHIGLDNEFDAGEPPARFASEDELKEMVKLGGRLQWHSRSHRRLTPLNDQETAAEMEVPERLKMIDPLGFRWLAYPHGEHDERVVSLAQKTFRGAVSVIQGNETDRFCLNRQQVFPDSRLPAPTIAIIIACYNYGSFLAEAVESVLRQTRPADEILISDDASTDETPEIADYYVRRFPGLVRYNRCPSNLGIIGHFNQAVSMTRSDYVCILGADNRFRSDYIELTSAALDSDPRAAIAYTDFALFGQRARIVYKQFPESWQGEIKQNAFFVIHFPEFDCAATDRLMKQNFMHGSSLFRRRAFEQAGGYQSIKERPEDHDLFLRIVHSGWGASRVPHPVLEYRQHSRGQANISRASSLELHVYKEQLAVCRKSAQGYRDELAASRKSAQGYRDELAASRKSACEKDGQIAALKAKLTKLSQELLELQVGSALDGMERHLKGRINVFVFGTGSLAEVVTRCLDRYNVSLRGYFDNNEKKWGTRFHDLEIGTPRLVRQSVVIVASQWKIEILEQLRRLGYSADAVVTLT